MKNISTLSILTLFLLTLFACRKDIDEPSKVTTLLEDPVITIIDYTPEKIDVTATVFGIVTNENGQPEADATVRLENNTTTTDERGRFVFSNITMNQAGTFLTVNKAGFFEGSDRFFPEEGSTNYTEITLLEQTQIGSFVSNQGGNLVSDQGQIELDFPPNSIVDVEGNLYTGEVLVHAKWVDPTADNVNEVMPGGLQGLQDGDQGEEVELVALASYGMMAVELTDPNGSPLNLGNDLNAELKFQIPDQLLDNAPATIPLWSFSNEYGVWVKEGTATKQGNYYVGDVSHFSWWNCDDPYTLIELSGTLFSEIDSAHSFVQVCLEIVSTGEIGCINTNQDGFFSGPVPLGQEFILTVNTWANCGNNTIYTDNIGPFSMDTDLGDIIIPDVNDELITITGTVENCSINPLTDGWVELTIGTTSFNLYVNDGTYSFNTYNCQGATELSVQGFSITDMEQGDVNTFTISPTMTIPEISACGTTFTEYYTVMVNDSTTTFLVVDGFIFGDSISVNASNPNSSYGVYLALQPANSVGTYDAASITGSLHNISMGDGSGGTLIKNCSLLDPCDFSVNITEYGVNPGDVVAGNYSGNVEFTEIIPGMPQQTGTYFLEAEFRFIVD